MHGQTNIKIKNKRFLKYYKKVIVPATYESRGITAYKIIIILIIIVVINITYWKLCISPCISSSLLNFPRICNNLLVTNSIKGNSPHKLPWRDREGVICSSTFSFNLDARWGVWSTPCPDNFAPGIDPISIVYEAGWVSRSVWMRAKKLAPSGIRSPDRPTPSELIHRLRYPGPRFGGS